MVTAKAHVEQQRFHGRLLVLLSTALCMSMAALMISLVGPLTTHTTLNTADSTSLKAKTAHPPHDGMVMGQLAHQQPSMSSVRPRVKAPGVAQGQLRGAPALAVISTAAGAAGNAAAAAAGTEAASRAEAAASPPATAKLDRPKDLLDGLSAKFLQQVLRLGNYSQLGSAPLLDPLVASNNYSQMEEVVRQQQSLFCRARLQELVVLGVHQTTVQGIKLHMYSQGDIVSSSLRGSGGWESQNIAQLRWAINQYTPNKGSGTSATPLVVDVGSNVGWMTFAAAKMGARVIAFEGMPMNQVLLRRSLCDNPHLMQHITLFATGLGDDIKDCAVVSSTANAGNGNVLCTVDVQAAMQNLSRKVPAEYNQFEVRGTMSIRRLDDLLSEDIHLLKLDVEGFEESVLKGAQRLLSRKRVKFLLTEVNPELRDQAGRRRYLRLLHEFGFNISTTGLAGPFIAQEVLHDPNAPLPSWEVYGVRRG